jgi:hypothetical protein
VSRERVFLGQRGGPKVFEIDAATTDDGRPIVFRISPRDVFPAGIDGEVCYSRLFLAVTHSAEVTLRVIPMLDGELLPGESQTFTLPAPPATTTAAVEISLGLSGTRPDGTVFGRFDLRGTHFSFILDTPAGRPAGELTISAAAVEVEIVRESRAPK